MDNLIFTEVEMYAKEYGANFLVKSFVTLSFKSKVDDRELTLKLKPYTKIDFSKFQYLGISKNWMKIKNDQGYIHLKDVETRLYKGTNSNGYPYHMLKCFIDKSLVLTVFLSDEEILIMEKYMDMNATFSGETKGIHKFKYEPKSI